MLVNCFKKLSKYLYRFRINILALVFLFLITLILKFDLPFLIRSESDGIMLIAFFQLWGCFAPINNSKKYFLLLGIVLVELLVVIDLQKIQGIEFPLTNLDLSYIGKNPLILLNSMGLSNIESYGLLAILCSIFGVAFYFFYVRKPADIHVLPYLVIYLLLGFFSSKGFLWVNKKYSQLTYLNWKQKDVPENFIDLNKRIGTLGFISFTSNDSIIKSDLFSIYKIKQKKIDLINYKKDFIFIKDSFELKKSPNIVFFLAESTFDPNKIFKFKNPVGDNFLFREKDQLEKNQSLFVSAIGGGTWKSEFEILTGLDSRTFGILGQYTHSYLSQRLIFTFPNYLSANGYDTKAFYPVNGKFYGASFGYKNYGFKNFYDANDLGIDENQWKTFSDYDMVLKSQKKWEYKNPFFYMYVSLKNHSPHYDCNDKNRKYNFFDTNDQNFNCIMDVYLNRALDTERAIYKIKSELDKIKTLTGRPYLIVVFGDHQPHTFVHPQFNRFRISNTNVDQTFVKYISSDNYLLPNIKEGYHISLIPSIVSSVINKPNKKIYFEEQLNYYKLNGRIIEYKNIPAQLELLGSYSQYIKN